MECKKEANLKKCNCTYEPCDKKGICCQCLYYHWSKKQLPACLFPPDAERSYDRSLTNFIKIYSSSKRRSD